MTDFISSSVASKLGFVIKNAYFHFVRYREAGKNWCFPYVAHLIPLNIANRGLVKLFSFCFRAGNVGGGRKKLPTQHAYKTGWTEENIDSKSHFALKNNFIANFYTLGERSCRGTLLHPK